MTRPPAEALRGLRVLVVEDETLVALLLEDMLSDLGCEVVGPAARIDDALRLAGTEAIEAAVLDINVAGQHVFPVAEALAARGVPFLFATGYGARGLASPYGNRPVLQKPYRQHQLAEMLAAVAGRPPER